MKCKVKKSWVNVEKEHTNDVRLARKIATDHVKEFGCQYYPSLMSMEKKLRRRK